MRESKTNNTAQMLKAAGWRSAGDLEPRPLDDVTTLLEGLPLAPPRQRVGILRVARQQYLTIASAEMGGPDEETPERLASVGNALLAAEKTYGRGGSEDGGPRR